MRRLFFKLAFFTVEMGMKKMVLGVALALLPAAGFADDVDFDAITSESYAAYMNVQNGAVATLNLENSCYKTVKGSIDTAKKCLVYTLAGGIIEGGYARQEGRGPAPSYQPDAIGERISKKLAESGLSTNQIEEARAYIGDNSTKVIMGLANAGMR
jgi:hypothetical protein